MNVRIIGRSGDLEPNPTLAAVEIAPGLAALLVITAASTSNTINASASAVQLLPANPARRGATVTNNAASGGNLHVIEIDAGGNPNDTIVAPGNAVDVTEGYLGRVSGWWEAPATGSAVVGEIS